jgi:Glycosyltransferase family 25 (LPS biosynthesis protein)
MNGQELMMDRNKSVFKIKGFPQILWLNLDNDTHRREYMEGQFKYWEIENHTRIAGFDGRVDDVCEHLSGRAPDNMSPNEIGCCMSHLKAIKYFYENSTDEYALIFEDDVVLDIAKYWNFSWKDFISHLPHDWDCVQLTTISTGNIHVRLHHYFINDFSAAAYLITRHHAAKIIKNHVRGDKFKLDNGVKPRAVSEDTVFGSGKTYSIPLFLYRLDLGSAIHPEHIDIYHKGSHDALLSYWQNQGCDMEIKELMEYDPYVGRISEPSRPES